MNEFTIVIPVYNEGDTLGSVLNDLGLPPGCREIIVVDDGSTDQTASVAQAPGVRVLKHPFNRGYGAAMKTGILAAQTDYVIGFDGDGQHRVTDLMKLVKIHDQYDLVMGIRGPESHCDWQRKFGKKLLQLFASVLTRRKIPDLNCGLRSFRTAVIRKYLHLMPDGFSFSTTSTISMYCLGYHVGHVPVIVQPRQGRKSNVKLFEDGLKSVLLIINLTILFNPMRVFLPLSAFFILTTLVYFIGYSIFIQVHVNPFMAMMFLTGIILFFMGAVCEQVSAIRREIHQ
jgi:glycosyltransferase involved in cell wall biosynthesis